MWRQNNINNKKEKCRRFETRLCLWHAFLQGDKEEHEQKIYATRACISFCFIISFLSLEDPHTNPHDLLHIQEIHCDWFFGGIASLAFLAVFVVANSCEIAGMAWHGMVIPGKHRTKQVHDASCLSTWRVWIWLCCFVQGTPAKSSSHKMGHNRERSEGFLGFTLSLKGVEWHWEAASHSATMLTW